MSKDICKYEINGSNICKHISKLIVNEIYEIKKVNITIGSRTCSKCPFCFFSPKENKNKEPIYVVCTCTNTNIEKYVRVVSIRKDYDSDYLYNDNNIGTIEEHIYFDKDMNVVNNCLHDVKTEVY